MKRARSFGFSTASVRSCARAALGRQLRVVQRTTAFGQRTTTFSALVLLRYAPSHQPLPLQARQYVGNIGGVKSHGARQHDLLGRAHMVERGQDAVLYRRYIFVSAFLHEQGDMNLMQATYQEAGPLLQWLGVPILRRRCLGVVSLIFCSMFAFDDILLRDCILLLSRPGKQSAK